MEVVLIILLFAVNVFALDCLYNQRTKTTGAMLIANLCLTVALAYQFQQMQKIFYIFLVVAGVIVIYYIVRVYLQKRKPKDKNIIKDEDRIIDVKEED